MRKIETRDSKLTKKLHKINREIWCLEKEKEQKKEELEKYIKRHRSLKFDGLETSDVETLKAIYGFLDEKYPVCWEGGLRYDDRGMKLFYWVDNDPDFLEIHITSSHNNLCFSGSTSWLCKVPTLQEKVRLIKYVKENVLKIIKKGSEE